MPEAEGASLKSSEAAERARERALDPALTAKDVAEARQEMDDAAFRRERLQNKRLRERLVDVLAREEDDRRLIVLEKVTAERDKLAAELKAAYPPIEAQLRDLLARLDVNDRATQALALPLEADDRWYVGPGNGPFELIQRRAGKT